MQKVLLTIKGTQIEGGETESIEFVTEGRLYKNADGCLLEYDETELTGASGVTTKLVLNDRSVTLSRSGAIDSHMVFTEKQVYESNFDTPFGTMRMSVFALHVDSRLEDKEGSIDLEYELNMGDMSTVNRLNLSFKNVKDCIN